MQNKINKYIFKCTQYDKKWHFISTLCFTFEMGLQKRMEDKEKENRWIDANKYRIVMFEMELHK